MKNKKANWHVIEEEDRKGKYHYYNRNYVGVLADELDGYAFSHAAQILNQMYADVFESPQSNVIICRGAI